jgi:hypothetical protein
MTDTEKVEAVRKWALDNLKCNHSLCSIAEACYEELHAKEILKLIGDEE